MHRRRSLPVPVVLVAIVALAGGAAARPSLARGTARARVHVVEMVRDSAGMHFTPRDVDAYPGDTVRFVNGEGRHNVDFVRDSNPAGVHLPAPTPLAEHPGEVVVVAVDLPPGRYFFQCDPHAAMHMVGHLVVHARAR